MEPVFTISCQGAGVCTLDELQELHHFKTLTDEDYVACRNNLTINGFSFPFSIWLSPDGIKYTVDGHMRLQVIKRMRDEGATIPQEYPINLVFAKDKEEAAKKIIASESKYGDINPSEFTEFLEEYNIDWDDVEDWADIPGLDTTWEGSAETTEDEPPAVDEQNPPVSQLGQVYQLGRHRLMCGDATKIEDVERLMGGQKADMVFTDPPYGVSIVSNNGSVGGGTEGKYRPILNDGNTQVAIDAYNLLSSMNIPKLIFWGGNYYASHLTDSSCWIVWDKQDGKQVTFADCELAWTNFTSPTRMYTHIWDGFRRDSEKGETRVHPTQKPIALLANIMKDYGSENDIVLDVFGGSGSTLIACEQTNRTCYMMELDPKYCDVIRKRYAKFIGKEQTWQEITPSI